MFLIIEIKFLQKYVLWCKKIKKESKILNKNLKMTEKNAAFHVYNYIAKFFNNGLQNVNFYETCSEQE